MNFINYLGDDKNRKALKWVFYLILAVVLVADYLAPREHVAFPWDAIFGFSAFYGLISCVLLIVVSKAVGHRFLMKKEDYYD